jgi:ribonuclease-3
MEQGRDQGSGTRKQEAGSREQGPGTGIQHPTSDLQSPPLDLDSFQQRIGYSFRDPALLLRALTHSSYVNEHPEEEASDNQRLEFLGDAVVDFIAGAWVFRRYPDFDEGQMTRLRAALVRTEMLARLARQAGIGEALRMGRGEEDAGGRERDANLCDAFEALVGALYLDGGLAAAETFVESLIGPVAEATLAAETYWDAKSRLQEWSQAALGATPRYRIVAEEGPDHAKTFVAEVLLAKKVAGQGCGPSKQAAEQAAAQAAWQALLEQESAAHQAPASAAWGLSCKSTNGEG